MFLNSWSLALFLCGIIILLLSGWAGLTAVRVLRFWDPASDGNRQIRLESEIWLSSTLIEYVLGFQILTLVLFVLAADSFAQVIVGAMCATGSLLANDFGMPLLTVKLAGVYFYGFWIVLHKLDVGVETYPLVRVKYWYLLALLPLLLLDLVLQFFYVAGLTPDIITSCCAVVFSPAAGGGQNLLGAVSQNGLLMVFYGLIFVLFCLSVRNRRTWHKPTAIIAAVLWVVFFAVALYAVTTVVSSYIYAMPYHHCPFCILKAEYKYIGFAIYGSLLPAVFFGISPVLLQPFSSRKDISAAIGKYQVTATRLAGVLLLLFTILASYHYLAYRLAGGEF